MKAHLFPWLFIFLCLSCSRSTPPADHQPHVIPQRIISMAPSLTEIVYALNADEMLVGVSSYCRYPQAAALKEKTGGLYDPNYEVITALKPDLVLLFDDNPDTIRNIHQLGFKTLAVEHETIDDILNSIRDIGKALGAEEESRALTGRLLQEIQAISARVDRADKPRVMVSIGRAVGTGELGQVYIAGNRNFYDDILDLAGGQNAYEGTIPYPSIAAEGILAINPDIIIDIIPSQGGDMLDETILKQDWQEVREVNAVKHDRIYMVTQEYASIPGPRFIRLLKDIVEMIHP